MTASPPRASPTDSAPTSRRARTDSRSRDVEPSTERESATIASPIDRAFARLRDDLGRTDASRLGECHRAGDRRRPRSLRPRALRCAISRAARRRHRPSPPRLRAVAKDYARAPYGFGGSRSEAADHTGEIEELCALLGDARGLRPGTVWIGDRLNTFAAITAVARGAAALVASDLISPSAIAIARAAHLPVVSDVAGLFGWARPGDLLAVDGDRGIVLVHPSSTDIERLRRAR